MDKESRDRIDAFSPAEWVSLGYEDLNQPSVVPYPTRTTITTLTNPIHRIFRFDGEGPEGKKPLWRFDEVFTRSRLESMLAPVLRLASQMIMSPGSVVFLYSLIYSPRQAIPELTQEGNTIIGPFRIPMYSYRRLTDRPQQYMRQKVDDALNRLAQNIHISVQEIDHIHQGCTFLDRGNLRPINITEDLCRIGSSSRIVLNSRCIIALEQLVARGGGSSGQIFNHQFSLAKVLCHEIAHAVSQAVGTTPLANIEEVRSLWNKSSRTWAKMMVRRQQREPYLEDESINECGYSWENAVFSGNVRKQVAQLDDPLWISDWPHALGPQWFTRGSGPEKFASRWLVSMNYLRKIHQQAFWDAVDTRNTTAFFVPKLLRVRFQRVGQEPGGYYIRIREP